MKKLPAIFLLALGVCACGSSNKDNEIRQKESQIQSIGQSSEVVLVLGNEVLNSDLKDSLEGMLTANVPGLNQCEDYFRVSRIPQSMDKGEFKKMHSRVLVKLDKSVKAPSLGTATNAMANPQLQIQITAPNLDELRSYVSSHAEYVRKMLVDHQLDIQARYLHDHHSKEVMKDLREVLDYVVDAPEEIRFTKKGKDFLWGSSRSSEKQLNMVFYTRPYFGALITDAKELSVLRDSVMKENIPGSEPDQWMETVWEGETPIVQVEERDLLGHRVAEMRGLWQMRNGAMGGPFVSLSFVDSVTHKLVVAEGFVFSPSTPKRDLMRKLEAALRTLKK